MQISTTAPIKLRDRDGKSAVVINLEAVFGYLPHEIMIRKVSGRSSCFTVCAPRKQEPNVIKPKKEVKKSDTK